MLHVLDDFLFTANTKEKCLLGLTSFQSICQFIYVPSIAKEKTVGPDTSLQSVGIMLESVFQGAMLPEDKPQKRYTLLTSFYSSQKVSLKELQSLIGLLNFSCSVILSGLGFFVVLLILRKVLQRPHHRVRLSKDDKADLQVWMRFRLVGFNDRAFFLDDLWLTSLTLKLFTDAAGKKGYGSVYGSCFMVHSLSHAAEFFLIVTGITLRIGGLTISNNCTCLVTDNAAQVEQVNFKT